MMIDWQNVGMLLHIVDKSKDHPRLQQLTNAALAELERHNQTAAQPKPVAPVIRTAAEIQERLDRQAQLDRDKAAAETAGDVGEAEPQTQSIRRV